MKELNLNGNTNLQLIRYGTSEWYYAADWPHGDMYEAQEIYNDGKETEGTSLFLVHYPDGAVYQPAEKRKNQCIGEPVYDNGQIYILCVRFDENLISVIRFDCEDHTVSEAASLPLDSIADCYNLRLHVHPPTLSRQPNDGSFELIWPERKSMRISSRESFFYRDQEYLYFSTWHEDPDYREEVIVRDTEGNLIQRMPGDISVMPDGQLWHIY